MRGGQVLWGNRPAIRPPLWLLVVTVDALRGGRDPPPSILPSPQRPRRRGRWAGDSLLALLTVGEGECVGRWVAPGLSSRRKPCRGLRPPQAPRERRPALPCRVRIQTAWAQDGLRRRRCLLGNGSLRFGRDDKRGRRVLRSPFDCAQGRRRPTGWKPVPPRTAGEAAEGRGWFREQAPETPKPRPAGRADGRAGGKLLPYGERTTGGGQAQVRGWRRVAAMRPVRMREAPRR